MNKSHLKHEENSELLDTLKEKFPKQYKTVLKILDYVSGEYKEVLDGEVIYLLIHVIKLTNQ